jgi:hypothetical protein
LLLVDKCILLADIIGIVPVGNGMFKAIMEKKMIKDFQAKFITSLYLAATIFLVTPVWAQSGGHASVGLGHGEEGYLHLQEMIKHYEFSLQMPDAGEELKTHGPVALQHAKEAIKHYNEALKHGNESLGRRASAPMAEGSGGGGHKEEEGSSHSHDEGSH